ncbi:hypothetical protein M0811_10397 [Anaeramoeba ignava]|uniref:Uncharacterized protein n=1 Tax=Anaeramoeba ignava TaxID=1746090 RepID=A0A9Q0LF75_ANAIG|nr:hypothetical protein M0811_10397 [Anaeramoeba ignava]
MLSIFGIFSLPFSIFVLIFCAHHGFHFFEYGGMVVTMIISPLEYNFLFEPIAESTKKVWQPSYLFEPKNNSTDSLYITIIHYFYLYCYLATAILCFGLFKRSITRWLWRWLFVIPSGFFSACTWVMFIPTLLIRMFFIRSVRSGMFPFIFFAPAALFGLVGIFQSLWTRQSTVHLTFDPSSSE